MTPALYSIESEKLVLGNMLQDVRRADDGTSQLIPMDFFEERNAVIFETIVALRVENTIPDSITVTSALGQQLTKVGGASYISSLIEYSTVLNYEEHVKILKEKSRRRALRRLLVEKRDELEKGENLDRIVGEIQTRSLDGLSQEINIKTMGETSIETLARLEEVSRTGGLTGLPTGFLEIDEHLGGLQRGELIIISGRPGSGKSALSFQTAVNMAAGGLNVLFFSIEMRARQLFSRMLSVRTGIQYSKIRNATLNDNEAKQLVAASSELSKVRLNIDDSSNAYVDHIVNQVRIEKRRKKIDVVFIDHLQLIRTRDARVGRVVEFDVITADLKGIAKELDISVVVLSQLSRQCENREDKRPILSDLRESGGIEQNADVVLGLYRDEYYNGATDENRNQAEVIVLKYRDGPTGKIKLLFYGELIKFQSYISGGASCSQF